MNLKETEMLFSLAILIIIFGSIFGFPLAATWLKQKAKERETLNGPQREEIAARLAELEERIHVLERIVTDERSELRRRFKDL